MYLNGIPNAMRRGNGLLAIICFGCAYMLTTIASAQTKGISEWTTSSADAARDSWQRGSSKITPQTAKDIKLLWKVKVSNKTMGMQSFREPLLISGVKTADGVKNLTILAGASNDVFVLDTDDGAILWQKKLKWESDKPQEAGEGRGFICTNAQSATPVVTPAGAASRYLYVLASDGYLHIMDLATGAENERPIQVLPLPYGKPYGLNLVNNVIYTVTGQGCAGNPNAM
jgi:outer membrane protein assembly factor BamB